MNDLLQEANQLLLDRRAVLDKYVIKEDHFGRITYVTNKNRDGVEFVDKMNEIKKREQPLYEKTRTSTPPHLLRSTIAQL